MPVFWISFADTQKPAGSQFSGVLLLEAADEEEALSKAKVESGTMKITIEDISHRDPPPEWFGRLLTAKESRDVNRIMCLKAQQDEDD
jgi:hypothetical protein